MRIDKALGFGNLITNTRRRSPRTTLVATKNGWVGQQSYSQACRGYEIFHPYPYPYPQIFTWISMDISIFTDACPVYL